MNDTSHISIGWLAAGLIALAGASSLGYGQGAAKAAPMQEKQESKPATPKAEDRDLDVEDLDGAMAGDLETLHAQLDRRMHALQRQFDAMRKRLDGGAAPMPRFRIFGPGAAMQSQGVEIRSENGKIAVTVREKGPDGAERVQTYEAPTMEEFREKYPEIAQRYLGGHGMTLVTPRLGRALRLPALPNDPSEEEIDLAPLDASSGDIARLIGPENGERLGVSIRPVGRELAGFLGLDKGTGFLVESVVPESAAEALGLKPNDLVLSINGKTIGKDSSIRESLSSVATGKTLRVELIRGLEGKKTFETEKKPVAKDEKAPRSTAR